MKYECTICEYFTDDSRDYKKHQSTKKHNNKKESIMSEQINQSTKIEKTTSSFDLLIIGVLK